MPTYCYTTKDGQTFERVYPASRYPKRIKVNGRVATLDIAAQHRHYRAAPGTWPLWSDAMGVHPSQIEEQREQDRKVGVSAEYDGMGRVKFISQAHRKSYCEAHGYFDQDAGYGDPQKRR